MDEQTTPVTGQYTIAIPNIDEFQTRNEFEEDVFLHMPKVAEMIYLGRDVTHSIDSLSRELGIGRTRFQKLYDAVKLEQAARLNIRSGSDLRSTMMIEIDEQIARLKQRADYIEAQRMEGLRKIGIAQDKGLDDTAKQDPKNQPTQEEMIHASMPPQAYYKILSSIESSLQKWTAQRAQLSGVLVQRKEIIHGDAKRLMDELYNNEEMQTKLAELEYQNQQLREQLAAKQSGSPVVTIEPPSLVNFNVHDHTPEST